MLIIARKAGQSLELRTETGELITIHVHEVRLGKASLGIECADSVHIQRGEVQGTYQRRGGDRC